MANPKQGDRVEVSQAEPQDYGNGGNGAPAPSDAPEPRAKAVKASFNIPEPELDGLRRVARAKRVNMTQALRQSIALMTFVTDLPRGSRLLVQETDGTEREIVFHNFA